MLSKVDRIITNKNFPHVFSHIPACRLDSPEMDSGTRIKLLICLVSHFGSFDNSCSFDSWTLPAWSPPAADTRFMLSRVRVNASIH